MSQETDIQIKREECGLKMDKKNENDNNDKARKRGSLNLVVYTCIIYTRMQNEVSSCSENERRGRGLTEKHAAFCTPYPAQTMTYDTVYQSQS